jgi:hypothetical protein
MPVAEAIVIAGDGRGARTTIGTAYRRDGDGLRERDDREE